MPIYAYLCTDCQERIEIQASVAEKERGLAVTCPRCGSKKVAQVFGTFSIGTGATRRGRSGSCDPRSGGGCCR